MLSPGCTSITRRANSRPNALVACTTRASACCDSIARSRVDSSAAAGFCPQDASTAHNPSTPNRNAVFFVCRLIAVAPLFCMLLLTVWLIRRLHRIGRAVMQARFLFVTLLPGIGFSNESGVIFGGVQVQEAIVPGRVDIDGLQRIGEGG